MPIIYDEPLDRKSVIPKIDSSTTRAYNAYKDLGVDDAEIHRSITSQYKREQEFLTAADTDKGPIVRTIKKMIRRKHQGKEYLIVIEDWNALDWKNTAVNPVTDIMQGMVRLPNIKTLVDEKGNRTARDVTTGLESYEFLFSKEEVDKWIKLTDQDKDSIKYCIRTSERRDDKLTYDQFVNTTWTEAMDILMQDGGFELAYVEALKSKKKS